MSAARNASSSVDATALTPRRTSGASRSAASVMSISDSDPRRSSSAADDPSAGAMWSASSTMSQCGSPLALRAAATAPSACVA